VISFAACIFLSAFLLFQIQPIVSKILLPWFGGTSAVWSSAMLFFQVALTGGYAYANGLVRKLSPRKQTVVHLTLMGTSVCLLIYLWTIWPSPITPPVSWRPDQIAQPVIYIFLLLTIIVGLPFFVLSTNSPLMQYWFSHKNPAQSPYWLYALSNIGSILGLIAYPILVEPNLTLRWQGWVWAGCYILFVFLAGRNAILAQQGTPTPLTAKQAPLPKYRPLTNKRPQTLWILLSACASILVLAVTSQITQEVAVIPFLWVLPLTIYLLTFVLAFSTRQWYHRQLFTVLLVLATAGWIYVTVNPYANFIIQIIVYNVFLFVAAMICHAELYALRPEASRLTHFYLLVSIGGAIGALFVNLVAPFIFPAYWELYFGFALIWILLAILSFQRKEAKSGSQFRLGLLTGAMATVVTIFAIFLLFISSSGYLYAHRNFYGVVRVKETTVGEEKTNQLVHGSTVHGFQYLDAELRTKSTSYFTRDSGVGLALLNNPHYGSGMRVGVIGLGVGTLAAYGQPGDSYRFYEINPVVVDLANGQGDYFSFIKDSPAAIDVVTGDGRLSLEKELKEGRKNNFDILILDAFNSDSVPVHLITRESFEIYLQHLAPDGLIAANVSNVRLDLRPVFWQLAQTFHLKMAVIQNKAGKVNPESYTSTWVLLTRNSTTLEVAAIAERMDSLDGFRKDIRLWTDDYSNLFQILK
jgi:spermidine synthase